MNGASTYLLALRCLFPMSNSALRRLPRVDDLASALPAEFSHARRVQAARQVLAGLASALEGRPTGNRRRGERRRAGASTCFLRGRCLQVLARGGRAVSRPRAECDGHRRPHRPGALAPERGRRGSRGARGARWQRTRSRRGKRRARAARHGCGACAVRDHGRRGRDDCQQRGGRDSARSGRAVRRRRSGVLARRAGRDRRRLSDARRHGAERLRAARSGDDQQDAPVGLQRSTCGQRAGARHPQGHPSNFRIAGFTEEASVEELAILGRELGLPIVDDLGSGAMFDLGPWGLSASRRFLLTSRRARTR
jgi:hypothetical protein